MIRPCSAALMLAQRLISSIVLPHPRHTPARASRVQILTQGVSIMRLSRGRVERDHKHCTWEGNQDCHKAENLYAGAEKRSAAELTLFLRADVRVGRHAMGGACSGIGPRAATTRSDGKVTITS